MDNEVARVKLETEIAHRGAIRQNHKAIQRLAQLCARLSGLRKEAVPKTEEIATHEQSLELFIGRVETSADVQELAKKSDTRKLEQAAQAAKRQSLSSSAAHAVRTVREVIGAMTTQLHDDHRQLIRTIAAQGSGR
jgi:hypothetical protein